MAIYAEIGLIQKEAKSLRITVRNKDTKAIIDVSTVTATLYCKDELQDTDYQFTVLNAVIDKSQGTSGILIVPLSGDNLDWNGIKYCVLKIEFSASNIDKAIFKLNLTSSVE